ncbi:WPP domain-interacting tail-anchored protein 1 [Acorus gramineus]|uniref:WPP domain-interacting tail-anchored protein 1 n=1 Tax=Acorus gramineus TaxID=55184 RepID=A0AAV9BDJ9_ACOGR|nr:WPP domain-interacting tail-anchored protein 1 [Acorus gramineus]
MALVGDHNGIPANDQILNSEDASTEKGIVVEVLTRVELDVAYSSEKVLNLDVLLMHVVERASDYESLSLETEEISSNTVEKALEFDILSGILGSEAKELENFMVSIQSDILDARQQVCLSENLGDASKEMEEMLHDAEESLKQSQEQVTEMRTQSERFERSLASGVQETWNSEDMNLHENGQFSPMNAKLKMQTADQQRHILRMLEKSLARELDLEKKLSESRHDNEELKLKLHYMERENLFMEESMEITMERMFEAENLSGALVGVSRELMGKLQVVQFNLNGSVKREDEILTNLRKSIEKVSLVEEQLRESNIQLQRERSSVKENQEYRNVSSKKIHEMENVIEDIKGKLSSWEERENLLKKQLQESNIQLEHANATVEAHQEQQNLLYSELTDMENLIEDLKSRVSKAENRAESIESKCTLLADTNMELNEELGFLRNRLECLETSLNQAEDAKLAASKDIGIHTKVITDLVLKLALERERLQDQISTWAEENEILAGRTRHLKDKMSVPMTFSETKDGAAALGHDSTTTTSIKPVEESTEKPSDAKLKVEECTEAAYVPETVMQPATVAKDAMVPKSKLETVRTIDAGILNHKYVFLAIVVVLLAVLALHMFQLQQ